MTKDPKDKPSELAKATPAAVTAPASVGPVEGLDEVLPEQIELPALMLVQAMSKNVGEARMGDWLLKSTGRVYGPRVRIVPIAAFNTRVFFDRETSTLLCSSLDGKRPSGGISPPDPRGKEYGDCGTCYFGQRQTDPKNPRSKLPAPCAAQINFIALIWGPDDKEVDRQLCRIQFKRTSWRCGQQIITNAQFSAARFKSLAAQLYELTAKVEEGGVGKYAVATSRVLGPTAATFPNIEAEARAYGAIWAGARDRLARDIVSEAEHEGDEAGGSAPPTAAASTNPGDAPADDLPF